MFYSLSACVRIRFACSRFVYVYLQEFVVRFADCLLHFHLPPLLLPSCSPSCFCHRLRVSYSFFICCLKISLLFARVFIIRQQNSFFFVRCSCHSRRRQMCISMFVSVRFSHSVDYLLFACKYACSASAMTSDARSRALTHSLARA